jgi:hypothetical protein
MERYLFFELEHVPPGLPVLGVPTSDGPVWLQLTAAEYRVAAVTPELSERLAARVRGVITARYPSVAVHAEE